MEKRNVKLIKLYDIFYIIDNSEIKKDDYYLSFETNYVDSTGKYVLYNLCSTLNGLEPKKITHSTTGDIGIYINESYINEVIYGCSVENMTEEEKCFKLNKDSSFTIDDIKKSWNQGGNWQDESEDISFAEFIQSLSSSKTEWDIEIDENNKIKLI
jgi:hypothetical protein